MMTTEARSEARSSEVGAASLRVGLLSGTSAVTALVGVLTIGLGAALDGGDGALGALTGAGIGLAVFAFGCGSLSLVARALPAATLVAALVTYLAQAVLLIALFVRLASVPFFNAGAGRLWFGLGMVAVTLAWMTALVVLTARQPLPDGGALGVPPQDGPEGPSGDLTGGER